MMMVEEWGTVRSTLRTMNRPLFLITLCVLQRNLIKGDSKPSQTAEVATLFLGEMAEECKTKMNLPSTKFGYIQF